MNETFGKNIDFFDMANGGNLALLESRGGYTSKVTEASELSVVLTRDVSGGFLNPVCKYSVTRTTDISFTLGRSYTYNGLSYFLTNVAIRTASGAWPIVSFAGTANEGSDAVKTHTVEIRVAARSKAQDVAGAIELGNDARLIDCVTVFRADPVVVFDLVKTGGISSVLRPVASDLQHGRAEVTAQTVFGSPSAAYGWDTTLHPDPIGNHEWYEKWEMTAIKSLT